MVNSLISDMSMAMQFQMRTLDICQENYPAMLPALKDTIYRIKRDRELQLQLELHEQQRGKEKNEPTSRLEASINRVRAKKVMESKMENSMLFGASESK